MNKYLKVTFGVLLAVGVLVPVSFAVLVFIVWQLVGLLGAVYK